MLSREGKRQELGCCFVSYDAKGIRYISGESRMRLVGLSTRAEDSMGMCLSRISTRKASKNVEGSLAKISFKNEVQYILNDTIRMYSSEGRVGDVLNAGDGACRFGLDVPPSQFFSPPFHSAKPVSFACS